MPTDKGLREAKRYGDVEFIFSDGESHPSIWDAEFIDEALDRLADRAYDPGVDYVVLAGPMVALVLFTTALCCAYPTPLALCYDIISGRYAPKKLGKNNEQQARAALPAGQGPAY